MVRRNNMIPNAHFHKDWKRRCRVLFNQPLRKRTRKIKRTQKIRKSLPRTIDQLRPLVQCPTERYKVRSRLGRGFTLKEIRAIDMTMNKCRQFGICVDYRRRTSNINLFRTNVERLKKYMSSLVFLSKNKEKLPIIKCNNKINEIPKTTMKIIARIPTVDEKKASPYLMRRISIGMNKKKRNKRNASLNKNE